MRSYDVIRSAPYCCVCAVLESIFRKHGYDISQYDVANFVGIVCSEKDLDSIPRQISNVKISEEPNDWGIHLSNHTLMDFFKSNNIRLKETYINARNFSDVNFSSLIDAVDSSLDVMLFLSHGRLYNISQNIDVGHCVLFLGRNKENLAYLDPGPMNLGINSKNEYDVYMAIKARGLYDGGISIISPTK